MNRIIKLLILSDVFVLTGFGLVDPIIAVFINEHIQGGSVFTAGIAIGLFLVTKSLMQVPFARHVDRHNNVFDLRWMVLGVACMALAPLLYLFADHIITIFAAQMLRGLGMGIANPVWFGIWSTHLDDGHMSYEWSLYSTLVGLGTAFAAAVGGGVAEFFGFNAAFFLVFTLTVLGCVSLLVLSRYIRRTNNGDDALLYKKRIIESTSSKRPRR